VFVFTSHTENLPTNLFEAMSLGLPVLSVDDESVDYLLVDGENGFKGSEEQMSQYAQRFYEDRSLVSAMSANAIKAVKTILDKDIAQEYVDLYQRVIKHFLEESQPIAQENLILTQLQNISKRVTKSFKKLLRY
jgi:glycosyltransferase involved in cell wall biosynthesis